MQNEKIRELENNIVQMGAMLEAISNILDGYETSDFMLSFPIVRRIAEAKAERDRLTKENKILTLKCATSLANNLCPDHRDKQAGKPCLACEIEALTAENGRLREALNSIANDDMAVCDSCDAYQETARAALEGGEYGN